MQDVHSDGASNPDLSLFSVCAALGLGFAFCWGLSILFNPALSFLSSDLIAHQITMSITAFAGGVVALTLVWGFSSKVFENQALLLSLGCLLSFPGSVILYLGNMVFPLPEALMVLAWALLGISYSLTLLGWVSFLSMIHTKHTLVTFALGSILGTALFFTAVIIGNLSLCVLLFLFGVSVSAVLLMTLLRIAKGQALVLGSQNGRIPLFVFKKFFSGCMHGCAYGFFVAFLLSFDTRTVLFALAFGLFGGLASLFLGFFEHRLHIDISIIQRVTLLPIIACLIIVSLLDRNGQLVCCIVFNISHAFYRTCALGILAVENSEFRLDPIRRSSIPLIQHLLGVALGLGIGLFVLFVYAQGFQVAGYFLGLIVLLLVAPALLDDLFDAMTKSSWLPDEQKEPELDMEKQNKANSFEWKVAGVCECYRLSAREKEVFAYLARGRNAQYIQYKLVLANGTVKTHILHIYQKLGVNSQQQLIDLIDEPPPLSD